MNANLKMTPKNYGDVSREIPVVMFGEFDSDHETSQALIQNISIYKRYCDERGHELNIIYTEIGKPE
jgi:hypothetical protein